MSKQLASHLLMVRPSNFGYNVETANDNAFQKKGKQWSDAQIQKKALKEFKGVVKLLRKAKISVMVIKDDKHPKKPDAIFPNNWITTHRNGLVITYPMFSPKRRFERNEKIIKRLKKHFHINKRIKYEAFEIADMFLEGTGSIVFDHKNKIAYACKSQRTNPVVFKDLCKSIGYKSILFKAVDAAKNPIYHTNVMMSIGADFAIVCSDSIPSKKHKERVLKQLKKAKKAVIEISYQQMQSFAGNVLQVKNKKGKRILLMSTTAYDAFTKEQLTVLKKKTEILQFSIPVIEHYGGGSLRCMIGELFLPLRKSE